MIRQTLGKYRILRWLGGGQFGDVYLAQDTLLGMEFALKVSRMRPADIQMLKDEARTLASLNHPNIVRFYSVDQIEGKFVLVTEYVPGSSLRERLERGHLEITESIRITTQILKALAWAHERGLIHRDLKPENILINEGGEVKVADFGLARFLKKGSLAASVAGTPFYMSPEAWAGRFLPASDLWSVGVMLYEMLTAVLPFGGANFEEIRNALMKGDVTDPTRLRDLPRSLGKTILSLLTKEPELRPSDASGVLRMLEPVSHTSFLPTKPASETQVEDFTLTAEQCDIVRSTATRLLVVGGAGSGKTSLLVYRVRHLIAQETQPDRLLLVAFSRRAAEEMRRRLERLAGHSLPDMWIETFHSLGWKFLRTEGWRLDLPAEFAVVDPAEITRKLSKKWGSNRAKALAERLILLRSEVKTCEDYRPEKPAERQLAEFWKDYLEAQRELNALDFEDLIFNSLRLLREDEELRDMWRSRFSNILVDELQDLSPDQFKLLRYLCGPDTGLFLTGDAAQSIYSWRGADRRLLEAAEKVFQPMERRELAASFRMGAEIVKFASNLMAHSTDAGGVPSVSLAQNPGHFEFYKAQGVADEARFVAAKITTLIEERGYRPCDFGILYRVNSYSRAFGEALAAQRIPASILGTAPFYERAEVRHFLNILGSIRKRSLRDVIPSWQWLLTLKPETNTLTAEGPLLKLAPQAKTRSRRAVDIFFEDAARWCSLQDEASPMDLLDFIAASKVASRRLTSPASRQALDELREAAASFRKGELGLFLDNIALLEDLDLASWSRDRVRLLSIHSAKGLEFKVVFLVGLIEGLFPLTPSVATDQGLEEERRLCYVAITRSKEMCYVSMPAKRFQESTTPSRFLLQMLGLL